MHSPTYITILSFIYMHNNLICTDIYPYLNSFKKYNRAYLYIKKRFNLHCLFEYWMKVNNPSTEDTTNYHF